MKRKPTPLYSGVYLKWMDNPQKPVFCVVLETFEDGSFKFVVLNNNAIITRGNLEGLFEEPTEEEIKNFWGDDSVQNLSEVKKILDQYGIETPQIEMIH